MAFWDRKIGSTDVAVAASRRAYAAAGVTDPDQDPRFRLFRQLQDRKSATEGTANRFNALCQEADALYYPTTRTQGGADHWPDHPTAKLRGKVHISLNDPQVYVDVPADLQALPPEVDYVPDSADQKEQEDADRREKLFWTWWQANDHDFSLGVVARIRALYGAAIVQPYWGEGIPRYRVIETPQNVRIGWGASDYSRMDWALNIFTLSPQAVRDEYGLGVKLEEIEGQANVPVVYPGAVDLYQSEDSAAIRSAYEQTQVEVFDYWYKDGKTVRNALYVGNYQVRDEAHDEFDDLPFIYIPNGKLPGRPYGRGELYDIEHIIRERDEVLSRLGQIFSRAEGPMWQINGANAPSTRPPDAAMPRPNAIAAPGPGNAINAVQPWMPEFEYNQYLDYLDNALARITGVNDVLLNLRSDASGSSKALRTEVSMYVPRISLKRQMLYDGMIFKLWRMSAKMWESKDPKAVKAILDGHYQIIVTPPEIVAHDDLEQMNRAVAAVQNNLVSIRTAMKWIGIANPTEELALIMAENTNGAIRPDKVLQELQLIGNARALNVAPNVSQAQAGQTITDQAVADLEARRAAAAKSQPPAPGAPGVGQPIPPASSLPPNAQAGGAALTSQTMQNNGQMSGRLLSSQEIPVGQ